MEPQTSGPTYTLIDQWTDGRNDRRIDRPSQRDARTDP